jgi:8-oxo-dGTP pyrophosphatase MutT (NUDIX family)
MRNAFDSMVRSAMHLYWRLTRGLTLGVRAVVIDEERRIFLVRHTYVRGWHLPGGGVEPGETALSALARELVEEGNIELTAPPRLHGVFFNARVSNRDHVACFVVQAFRQSAPPTPNHEIAAARFFAFDEMPGDTSAGTRARIAEVLLGVPMSEHW